MDQSVDEEFRTSRPDLERRLREGIEIDKSHRTLLNMAVFPFTRRTQRKDTSLATLTGFEFVRGSPLAELGIPNFDFLLFRPPDNRENATALLGEVKSSISSLGGVVNEIQQKAAEAAKRINYVKEAYLELPASDQVRVEHVAMVSSGDSSAMVNAVADQEGGIVVWHGSPAGSPVLRIAEPPNFPQRHTMLHGSKELNDVLKGRGFATNRKCFEVWPNSHPVSRLRSLISSANPTEDGYVIREGVLQVNLSSVDLFYLGAAAIGTQVKSLIDLGLRVGFIQAGEASGEFEFTLKTRNPSSLERDMEKKWIEYAITDRRETERNRRVEELREVLLRKKAAHPELSEFDTSNRASTQHTAGVPPREWLLTEEMDLGSFPSVATEPTFHQP